MAGKARTLLTVFVLCATAVAFPVESGTAGTAPVIFIGRVFDARSRRPVAAADVEVPGVGLFATDEEGLFRFETDAGVLTVRVSRVGYRLRTWANVTPGPVREFPMMPELITLDDVTVTAGRMPLPIAASGPVTIIELDGRQTAGTTDPAEALRRAPGVVGNDYVNYSSLSLRGTGIEHTLLALDGIRLNSSQNGTFDLTTLPVGVARRAEIARGGGSALYGSSPVGGTVNLITAEPERLAASLRTGVGAFGRRYLAATHENRRAPLGYLVGVAADAADNDFTWHDDSGRAREMANADRSSLGVFGKGSWREAAHRFNLFGLWSSTERGVPGPRDWPSSSARRDDRQGLASLRHTFEPDERLLLDSRVSAGRSWQHYRDPAAFVPASDTHALATAGGKVDAIWTPKHWLTLAAAVELDRDQLVSSAVGDASRSDFAGVGQARIAWQGLAVQPSLRVERLRRDRLPGRSPTTPPRSDSASHRATTDVTSPRATVTWHGSLPARGAQAGLPVAAWASCGRSFRAPTFNELFWPEDAWTRGNPALEPEWATGYELGLRSAGDISARSRATYRASLGWYHNSLTNLIQWRPDDSLRWRPVNVAGADISGLEAELALDLGGVGFSGDAGWCRARSGGRRLLYRPEFNARAEAWASAEWQRLDARLTLAADLSGDRLTDPALPDTTPQVMPGYGTLDAGVALGWQPGPARYALSAGVRNLADARYETVRHYPVPGRSWYAELGFEFR
ncbi:MAG: TonB-dependent receptor [bacterium]